MKKRLLDFSEAPVAVQSVPAAAPQVVVPAGLVVVPLCEFVRGPAYPGAFGRMCSGYGICFNYGKPAVYAACITRKKLLKEKA